MRSNGGAQPRHARGTSVLARLRGVSAAALTAVLALAGLVVLALPAHAVATRTVAFWSMDEPDGSTTLVDSSGNGRHGAVGSLVTAGTVVDGATGHRFATHLPADGAFPGHSDTVPHHPEMNPDAGDFSVTVRYRTTYSFGNILQKGQGTAVGGYWKVEAPEGKPRCLFRGGNGASRTGYSNTALTDGRWHTVRCVRTSSFVEMYVDGVRTSRLNGPTGTIANNAQLSIGGKSQCDGVQTTCDYFIGDIDYVRLEKGSGGAANAAPVAAADVSCVGLVCSVSGAGSTDADGAVQRHQWDFGDGTVVDGGSVPTSSHSYEGPGTYTVRLTVTDDRGATSVTERTVTVAPVEERISFVGQSTTNGNLTTHAAAMPAGLEPGDALLMFLSQNNQATTTGPTGVTGWTQLDARAAGGYGRTTVWSKVATAADAGATVRLPMSAQTKGNLVVAAYRGTSSSPVASLVGRTDATSSTARTTPLASVAEAQSWGVSYWMHGDSASSSLTAPSGVVARSTSSQTGGGRVTTLLADSGASLPPGSYGGLVATGAAASTTSTAYTVVLAPGRGDEPPPPNEPPTAAFAVSCAALTCTFSGEGSNDPDGRIVSHAWQLGDGSTDAETWGATGSHTYAAAGSYEVELTVADDAGATATARRTVVVAEQQADIAFVAQATANANAAAHTVQVPAAVQPGDALLAFFSQNNTAATTGPSGWTEVGSRAGGTTRTTVWRTVATAQDAGSTVRVTMSSQGKGNLVVAAYRGVDAEQPVAELASASGTVASASHPTPTVAVTAEGRWAVSYWMHGDGSSTALTAPSGVQVRTTSSQTGSGRVTTLLADSGAPVPTGSYGGLQASGAAPSSKWTAWTILLAPEG